VVIPLVDETAAVLALWLWCLDSDARRAGINPAPTMPRCSSAYFRDDEKKRQLHTVAFLCVVLASYKFGQRCRRHQSVLVELFASHQSRQ
jgi:hypothetical protein